MNTTWKVAFVTAVVVGATRDMNADQTLNGAVGLPLNPTARLPLPNSVQAQGSYFDLGSVPGNSFRFYGVHAAGRVGEMPLEISGGVERLDARGGARFSGVDRNGIALGAKYLVSPETLPRVRFAVGAGYSRALLKNWHAYVVGTRDLRRVANLIPATVHAGVRYDRFSLADVGGPKSSRASVFGGVEIPIPIRPTADLSFVGELQSKNTDGGSTPYSAAIRFRPAGQNFSAIIGLQRQGLTGDNGVFAQVGFKF